MSNQKYWLGFNLVKHLGGARLKELLAVFGTARDVWEAKERDLRETGLNNQPLQALLKARQTLDLDAEMGKVQAAGAYLITLADSAYPENLRHIPDAPYVLYVRGSLVPTDILSIGMVGTRRASRYGLDVANRMAYWLAKQEVTIVSGMAQGIDSAAHQGALEAEGRTIAVMGCGIDIIYPRENAELSERIIENGAIISELPLGAPPAGSNFPRRNRIISGLSFGVLVAEAPESSGALITAEAALEQGRDVFAIPANIFNPMGTGCNRLIQDGAKLVMRASDILDDLDIAYHNQVAQTKTETIAPSNDLESQIMECLDTDTIHVDEIIRQTGLNSSEVISTLTILELKGLAQKVGAMQYCLPR